ncbi:unnamed protein product [Brassicogethes aeneus]|uniref:Uncharacterized protein n=1 Tax=Brassicogethes aeneus TaxID=1431903 RepID=A0A9P0B274_BRAAE|nr:unnamed protein product [Brassicogethes aeneus]
MAGKPELSAAPGVQNVVVYVSNDNFAQAYAVSGPNASQNPHQHHNGVYAQHHNPAPRSYCLEKQQIKPQEYPHLIGGGQVHQGGYHVKVQDEAGYEGGGYVTVVGGPDQSIRCDSVKSEAAESSCSSLSSTEEGLVVVQHPPQDLVVYDSSVSVRNGGVLVAVGPAPPHQSNLVNQNNPANAGAAVPPGWKRIVNNGAVFYIRYKHDAEVPHGHDAEVPHGHDAEVPHGHDAEVPHGHDAEVPHGHDAEVPHGHDAEVPHGHDAEVPHGHDAEVPHRHDAELPHRHDVELPHRHDAELPLMRIRVQTSITALIYKSVLL